MHGIANPVVTCALLSDLKFKLSLSPVQSNWQLTYNNLVLGLMLFLDRWRIFMNDERVAHVIVAIRAIPARIQSGKIKL